MLPTQLPCGGSGVSSLVDRLGPLPTVSSSQTEATDARAWASPQRDPSDRFLLRHRGMKSFHVAFGVGLLLLGLEAGPARAGSVDQVRGRYQDQVPIATPA